MVKFTNNKLVDNATNSEAVNIKTCSTQQHRVINYLQLVVVC